MRFQAQLSTIKALRPDVFLMQEARGLDADGGARLFAMEHHIGMRGFLAVAPRTGQHVVIFFREPLRVISFEADSAHFHHALATLKVIVPGLEESITFTSTHLCPNGPEVRRREAAYLAICAGSERYMLIAGELNFASPHDPEPEDFNGLPAHDRSRYLADDLSSIDRSVLAKLEAAGWVDLGNLLDASNQITADYRLAALENAGPIVDSEPIGQVIGDGWFASTIIASVLIGWLLWGEVTCAVGTVRFATELVLTLALSVVAWAGQ